VQEIFDTFFYFFTQKPTKDAYLLCIYIVLTLQIVQSISRANYGLFLAWILKEGSAQKKVRDD